MSAHNLAWFISPVTWGMMPVWTETIWSIEVMDLGLVSEGLLVDPPECLPLVLYGFLWDFPNKKATHMASFMILMSFIGIIALLDSLTRDLKDQWFSM